MVPTFGLTHIAIAVRDLDRSAQFSQQVFGARVVFRDVGLVQVQTPGARDALILEHAPERAGPGGGIAHFGFRLIAPGDIQGARLAVEFAGGTIRQQGEFVAGEPYLFALDPDGYELEIWCELPTGGDFGLR